MKTLILTSVLLIVLNICSAQSLWINDPRNWGGGAGTIEETKITYEPKGLFVKVDWEIEFSAKGLAEFTESDTVEVVYNFNLPEGAIVNDSWLWFEDTILTALIIDRWSASRVYENIVERRQDPSILYKNGETHYELRIFPMAAKESRKVKLSFLLPLDRMEKSISTRFLSENLLVSKNPIKTIELNAILSDEYKNPLITGENEIHLEPMNIGGDQIIYQNFIEFEDLRKNQKLEIGSILNEGYHFSYFENGEEKFYQLALFPGEGIDKAKPQKVLFLIDFQSENSDLSQGELLKLLETDLLDLMTDIDSFNILYHDFEMQMVSESWISGDSLSVIDAIKDLGSEPFVSYSNLPTLLASGIKHGLEEEGSKLILMANSDKLDDVNSANHLIEDLLDLMEPALPVFICDFQTRGYNYNWINNYNYRGNEYFYRNLAKITGGDYFHSFDGISFSDCFRSTYLSATNQTGLVDIHTTLENGLCYGRYNLSKETNSFFNSPYLEIGRFSGEFPFEIEISGLLDEEIISKKISITKEEAIVADSLTALYWYGNEIIKMENSYNSYSIINDIIDKSIDKRILSNYTAFLCLEPGMMGELEEVNERNLVDLGMEDGSGIVSSNEIEVSNMEVEVYPNPSSDIINIDIQLPEGSDLSNAKYEIYDLFGKRIAVFENESELRLKFVWDCTDLNGGKVASGTYIFICTTLEGRVSKKLVVL